MLARPRAKDEAHTPAGLLASRWFSRTSEFRRCRFLGCAGEAGRWWEPESGCSNLNKGPSGGKRVKDPGFDIGGGDGGSVTRPMPNKRREGLDRTCFPSTTRQRCLTIEAPRSPRRSRETRDLSPTRPTCRRRRPRGFESQASRFIFVRPVVDRIQAHPLDPDRGGNKTIPFCFRGSPPLIRSNSLDARPAR